MAVANQSCPAAGSSICRRQMLGRRLINVTPHGHGGRNASSLHGRSAKEHQAGRERLIVCTAHRNIARATATGSVPVAVTSFSSSSKQLLQARRQPRMPSAEELARVQLPALASSFPSMLHPQYKQVKAECDEWIEKVAELPSAAACRFLRDCLLPRLVCRFIPRALPGRRLLIAIKFIAWLMIADDDDDHPEVLGSDYGSTSHRADRIMAILTSHRPAETLDFDESHRLISKRSSRQLAALAELWQDMCTDMTPLLRSRLTSSMADYLEGIKMQAALRNQDLAPDLNSYMEIRQHASFTIPAFLIAEYASGVELHQEACENAHVMELQRKSVDYVSLCNDIFSCYKEISVGDYFNLPSILYTCDIPTGTSTRPCVSFQDAIDHVDQLAQGLDARCSSLIASLRDEYSKPSTDPTEAYHVHAFLDVMALGMSGALAWFFETPRYPRPCTQDQPPNYFSEEQCNYN